VPPRENALLGHFASLVNRVDEQEFWNPYLAKIVFQSFFILMTVQPFFFASS